MLGILVSWPALALVPAALFGALYLRRRGTLSAVAAIAWLVYAAYEYGMKLRMLCSGECNIRVDLLVLYPVLAMLSLMALASAAWPRSR